MKFSCPACGADVLFKSRSSVFGVCSYCNSTLVRQDLNLEAVGKMSPMPQDLSPLQVGTSGKFGSSRFEIVGRQRIGWAQGSWNEWFLSFDDGKEGWLADAQGHYLVSFQKEIPSDLPPLEKLNVNSAVTIGGKNYSVDDRRDVVCLSSQGELPVRGVEGRKSISIDMTGPDQTYANIDFSSEGNRLFLGKYVEFEDLKLMNLREIDGW